MSNYPLVSVIIPNWNGFQDTQKLLSSLTKIKYDLKKMEVILIDNGSTDDSPSQLKSITPLLKDKFKQFKVYRLKQNVGFGPALNYGLKKASKLSIYYWRLDNDIILGKNSLIKMIEQMKANSMLGICGSVVYPLSNYRNISQNKAYKAHIGSTISLLTTNVYDKFVTTERLNLVTKHNRVYENITYTIGCSNIIKKSVLNKIGMIDENFFLYYDEADYSIRAHNAGFRIATVLDSVVFHKGSASTGGIRKPLGIYHAAKSELYFFFKYTGIFFVFLFPYLIIKRLLLTIIRLSLQGNMNLLAKGISMNIKAIISFFKIIK